MRSMLFTTLLGLGLLPSFAQIWESKNIDFALPSQGWRVRTVDENVAWTFGFTIADDPFEAWSFTDSEFTCQRTLDGGNTWEELPFKILEEQSGYICDIEGVSDMMACVSYYSYDEGPLLYKTTDGGNTWTHNNAGVDVFLNWVQFYDTLHGVSFGDAGEDGYFQIGLTSDGGATWTRIQNENSIEVLYDDEYGVYGDFAVRGDFIYTRSDYDRIFYSSDRGNTWHVTNLPDSVGGSLWGIACNDNADLFAAYNTDETNQFFLFKREMTSGTWIDITPSDNQGYITGLTAIPGTQTILLNKHIDFAEDLTYVTLAGLNAGSQWIEASRNQGYRTGFMEFFNARAGYACEIPGDYDNPSDNVFVYNGSPITGLYSQQILRGMLHIYPNPASEYMTVKFASDEVCDYEILLHDVTGRLVERRGISQTSRIEETFPVAYLASGIYTITVSNASGYLTQEFVR